MKVQVRQGVFETNSSSVHAICICDSWNKEETETYKDDIYTFYNSEFGWEDDDTYHVGDYLYTIAIDLDDEENFKEKASKYLEELGILADFDNSHRWSYVDHSYEAQGFYNWALESTENFYRCLFSNSFIQTGNDNNSECYELVKSVYENFNGKDKWLKTN